MRAHRASFESVCPDAIDGFQAWWRGDPPAAGRRSILILFDPIEGRRRDRHHWASVAGLPGLRPRYRDYAEVTATLQVRDSVKGIRNGERLAGSS